MVKAKINSYTTVLNALTRLQKYYDYDTQTRFPDILISNEKKKDY
jgi:hypothetical protein